MGHRADSAGRREHASRPAPAAGSGWCSRRIPRASAAAVEFIRDRRVAAPTPRASARRPAICRCGAASIATFRSSARTPGTPLRRDARRRPGAAGVPRSTRRCRSSCSSRSVRGRVRREDAGAGARRRVARGATRSTRGRRRAQRDRPRGLDPIAVDSRWLLVGAGAARDVLARPPRQRPAPRAGLLPATALVTIMLVLSDARPAAAVASPTRRVAGLAYAYTLASYRALLTDASFYGMVGGHARLRRRPRWSCSWSSASRSRWLIDAARRRARAGHAGRPRRGRQRLGDPRRARRRAVEDPADREPLGDRELLPRRGSASGPLPLDLVAGPSPWSRSSSPTSGAAARSA